MRKKDTHTKMKIFILILVGMGSILQAQKFTSLAQTPPMGWNSWNYFACDSLNEEVVKATADAMLNSGMKEAGYQYIVIDDCWQIDRDSKGKIIVDSIKFPHGIKALADYIHSIGLKFGIYSDAGTHTCGGHPGSKDYELIDARTYAEWGVDYLKYDWCNTEGQEVKSSYTKMRDALFKAKRPIVFSICDWGESRTWEWADTVGHLWRTTLDIAPRWDGNRWGNQLGWTEILEKQVGLEKYAGPRHWNDPDMLEVGNPGLNINESKTHFTMWCMLAAPLICGNNLMNMSDSIQAILTNKNLIAIDQDSLGKQGFKIYDEGNFEIWQKPLVNGDIAIAFLNLENKTKDFTFEFNKLPIKGVQGTYKALNLWNNTKLALSDDKINISIPARGVLIYRLSEE